MNDAAVTAATFRFHASAAGGAGDARSDSRASEVDLDILCGGDVNAVDKPDLVRIVLHDDRSGAGPVAKETDAAHQRAVGDAGGGKDDALAGREIARPVNLLEVGNPHRPAALFVLRFAYDEPRQDFAIQAAHRRGGQN